MNNLTSCFLSPFFLQWRLYSFVISDWPAVNLSPPCLFHSRKSLTRTRVCQTRCHSLQVHTCIWLSFIIIFFLGGGGGGTRHLLPLEQNPEMNSDCIYMYMYAM